MARRAKLAVVPDPVPGLDAAIQDFLGGLRAEGKSPKTLVYYTATLTKVFLPWAVERGVSGFELLDQRCLDEFNAFLLDRPGKPLAKSSAASYLRAVRHFVRWTEEQKLTAGLKVRQVRVPRPVLDILSRTEINALESAADTERDKLIVRVLGDCGLRLSELLGLKADDILQQGSGWFLRVEGRSYGGGAKGDKGRLVPVPPTVAKRLRRLATQGRQAETYADNIFVTLRKRRTGAYEPLAARGVQVMLDSVGQRAGITKPLHPHALRHAYVTNNLRSGMNPLLIAQSAGHANLAMITNVYSHLNASDAYAAMMKAMIDDRAD